MAEVDGRLARGGVVVLRPVGGDLDLPRTLAATDRAERATHVPHRVRPAREQPLGGLGPRRGGEVQVVLQPAEHRVAHRTTDQRELLTRPGEPPARARRVTTAIRPSSATARCCISATFIGEGGCSDTGGNSMPAPVSTLRRGLGSLALRCDPPCRLPRCRMPRGPGGGADGGVDGGGPRRGGGRTPGRGRGDRRRPAEGHHGHADPLGHPAPGHGHGDRRGDQPLRVGLAGPAGLPVRLRGADRRGGGAGRGGRDRPPHGGRQPAGHRGALHRARRPRPGRDDDLLGHRAPGRPRHQRRAGRLLDRRPRPRRRGRRARRCRGRTSPHVRPVDAARHVPRAAGAHGPVAPGGPPGPRQPAARPVQVAAHAGSRGPAGAGALVRGLVTRADHLGRGPRGARRGRVGGRGQPGPGHRRRRFGPRRGGRAEPLPGGLARVGGPRHRGARRAEHPRRGGRAEPRGAGRGALAGPLPAYRRACAADRRFPTEGSTSPP